MEVPESEPLPEDALSSLVADEQAAAAASAASAEGQAAKRALAGVAAALAARGKPGKISAHMAKAAAAPQSKEERANADAKRQALLRKQKSQRQRRNVPVLGRRASEVLPAVIGTFQDYSSHRAARIVSEDVVQRAQEAKPQKLQWSDYEHELTTEERALRAMGLGTVAEPPTGLRR